MPQVICFQIYIFSFSVATTFLLPCSPILANTLTEDEGNIYPVLKQKKTKTKPTNPKTLGVEEYIGENFHII